MESKILVLSDSGEETYDFKLEKDVSYKSFDVRKSFFSRLLYRILYLTKTAFLFYSYKLRDISLRDYDLILVNETGYPVQLLKYIRNKNHDCHLFYLLWNTVGSIKSPLFFNEKREFQSLLNLQNLYGYRIVSFDKKDCEKFGFIFNKQCVPKLNFKNNEVKLLQDIFFIGQDKGRMSFLMSLQKLFESEGLVFNCFVFPDKTKTYTSAEEKFYYKGDFLSYQEVVSIDLQSRAILDIVQDGQEGLTWRPIEAIYYNKKLITNFKAIQTYEFYDTNNIFILGLDDLKKLKEFIYAPFNPVPSNVIEEYTFSHLIEKLENINF